LTSAAGDHFEGCLMNGMSTTDSIWTPDRVEQLKQLWAERLSASAIAARLGRGINRNQVIGKAHRLGLSGRAPRQAPQSRGDTGGGAVQAIRSKLARGAPGPGANKSPAVRLLRQANSAATDRFSIGGRLKALAPKPITLPTSPFKLDPAGVEEMVDEAPIAPTADADRKGVTLFDLTPSSCRWPVGHPGSSGFFFCGAPGADVEHRQPYCAGTLCRRFMTTTGEAWR
jgi:GcrA cell cycle regulator